MNRNISKGPAGLQLSYSYPSPGAISRQKTDIPARVFDGDITKAMPRDAFVQSIVGLLVARSLLIWSNAMASIRKPFLFAAIGLTLIVTAGMGVYFAQDLLPGNLQAMLNGTRPKQHDSKKKETKKEIVAELEPFAVNLAGPGLSRYLRLVLRVSLQEEEDKQRIKEAATQIRDSLLMLLTSKRADELLTVEGKTQLRGEVVGEINKAAGKELVKAVYFKDFLIQ